MSPGHVLPFRSVGIPLIIQVPFAILIEHSVWIVHPSVERGMVIGRAIFLTVRGVERVGEGEVLPAGVLLGLAHCRSVLRGNDVEHNIVALVAAEIERHLVVYLRFRKFHEYSLVDFSVDDHVDASVVVVVLHRHQKISAVARDAHESIVGAEIVHFNAVVGLCRRGGEHPSCDHYGY